MIIFLLLTFLIVIVTMSYGYKKCGEAIIQNKKLKKALILNVASFFSVIGTFILIFLIPGVVKAATGADVSQSAGLGYIGAALSTGLAAIGAGYAVGATGASALGAISEDPKMFGKTLIYVGLGEGIAIYGLIISIIIFSKI